MSDAISCSSCAAKLAVPVGAAGKALRCPRCGTHTSVPATPPATPPPAPPPRVRPTVVREKPEPEEDDPPPRRRDRDEDDRDDEPRPRRRRRREKVVVPGWVWTVGVPLIGMLIGVPLVVTRGKRDGRDTVQIRIPASEPQAPPWQPQAPPNAIVVKPTIVWVKRTHEASGTTWEFPSMGGRWIDHRASAIDVNGQPVEFSVDIEAIRPEMNRYTQVQMAQLGESYWVSKTVEKIDLFEGRPRLLGRDQSGYSWHVADPNWYYRFGVFNPNADVGGERVKRFLESIRITRAPPPGTRLGEEIPFGWDRVTVSVGIQSEMSALMPQGSPPEWVKRREGLFEGHPTTSRAMPNPKGDEDIVVSMLSLPSGGVFPAPKWFRESKHLTVGGYPAAYSDLANGDFRVVSVRIPVEERQFSYVVVSGYNLDPDGPDVKRVLESISFTLPKKNGLRPPIDYAPTWARRFAPGTSFSVELPGRWRPLREGGANDPAGTNWHTESELPLRNKSDLKFRVNATTTPKSPPTDPRTSADAMIRRLNGIRTPGSDDFLGPIQIGGRPGGFFGRYSAAGFGDITVELFEPNATFSLKIIGDAIRPETPEVKRCLDSVSFTIPRPTAKK